MSIAEQITALQNDKVAIAEAIVAKGGTVGSGDGFDDFALCIETIKVPQRQSIKFTAETAGSTIKLYHNGSASSSYPDWIIYTSTDDMNWTSYTLNTVITLTNVGDTVYFSGNINNYLPQSASNYHQFVMTGKLACEGNCMGLISQDSSLIRTSNYQFYYLFKDCSALSTAPDLPALSIGDYAYKGMFYGCTSLINAPIISATTAGLGCCAAMFNRCTSLITAPELYITNTTKDCYAGMFSWCTSLIYPPSILRATTLNTFCYSGMFDMCRNLTTAPELPATTLVAYCYYGMFGSCSKLNSITVGFSDWGASTCTLNWMNSVASTGVFKCPGALPNTSGSSYIPTGWAYCPDNILTFVAETANSTIALTQQGSGTAWTIYTSTDASTWTSYTLGSVITLTNVGDFVYIKGASANNVAQSDLNYHKFTMSGQIACYGNCNALISDTAANVALAKYIFFNLFSGCSALTTAPELPATTLAESCYQQMFYGCTSLTTAPELPATTLAIYCYRSMFLGCTSLTTAPELPATTLAERCYQQMFHGCTSLTTAPELPATTLESYCYFYLFFNCSHLNSITVRFTNWNSNNTNNWVSGVAASGTFKCPSALADRRGSTNIPTYWTKVDL